MEEHAIDYNSETIVQLRVLLKKRKIKYKGLMHKAQLVAALEEDDTAISTAQETRPPKRNTEGIEGPPHKKAKGKPQVESHDALGHSDLRACAKQSDPMTLLGSREDHVEVSTGQDELMRQEVGLVDQVKIQVRRVKKRKRAAIRQPGLRLRLQYSWSQLFHRKFQANSLRNSFMSLPRELRDKVYRHIFDHKDITYTGLTLSYDAHDDSFWYKNYLNWEYLHDQAEFRRIIDSLLMLGALNKEIRKEARSMFWSLAVVKISRAEVSPQLCYFTIVERFLRGLGDEGRFGLRYLRVDRPGDIELSQQGYTAFGRTLQYIADCTSLTKLRIDVREELLFRNDHAGLEDFFLRGQTLRSKGIDSLREIFQSLPHLQDVDIEQGEDFSMPRWTDWANISPFLCFAFTGNRLVLLRLIKKRELEGTKLQQKHGRIWVQFEYSDVLDDHRDQYQGLGEDSLWQQCAVQPGDYEAWLSGGRIGHDTSS